MLRVISRPMTVPAERIALLNAGLSIICSSMLGSAFSTGLGIGGSSIPSGSSGGRSTASSGADASLAASIS